MQYICEDCPRRCGILRAEEGNGVCGMGAMPRIARAAPHFDEEPVISGTKGSGTVFFSGCSLGCRFCQNYDLSHHGFGKTTDIDGLKRIYANLRAQGVHNINLVNPSHFATAIGLSLEENPGLPVVWNSGGYDRVETLQKMDGKVNIYLPDLKYIFSATAKRYSFAEDYFTFAGPALKEMLRQTGPVQLGKDGLMKRGLMVRHLILPGKAKESCLILSWIARNLPGAWVSLMAQYTPMGDVRGIDQLERRLTQEEYDTVVNHMMDLGLEDGFVQELSSSDEKYIPKFDLTGVDS